MNALPITPDQRLLQVQQELTRRGIQVRGMTFNPGAVALPLSDAKAQVAEVFEAFLDGRCRPMARHLIEDTGSNELPAFLAARQDAANGDVFSAGVVPD